MAFVCGMCEDKSGVYNLDGKELKADELIM